MSLESIKVIVNGARGRMGQETVRAVSGAEGLDLVGETDLGDDLEGQVAATGAQVVVDFTEPAVALANTRAILRSGARPVVGTTGLRPDEIESLQREAADLKRGGVIAPNFAVGAVLLMKFAADAARYLPDVEVVELHHDRKLDAPSGTALKTIELIREAVPEERPRLPGEKESVTGARGGRYLGVPVHSVRLPGLVAHQEVLLGGVGQLLSLRHDALNRESFMPGVVLAVRKVVELDRLYYGLETILDL